MNEKQVRPLSCILMLWYLCCKHKKDKNKLLFVPETIYKTSM